MSSTCCGIDVPDRSRYPAHCQDLSMAQVGAIGPEAVMGWQLGRVIWVCTNKYFYLHSFYTCNAEWVVVAVTLHPRRRSR